MLFSENWLQNHSRFLLHFLIHIGVLRLDKKFELIPTNNFQVMSTFKMNQFLKKAWAIAYSPFFFP